MTEALLILVLIVGSGACDDGSDAAPAQRDGGVEDARVGDAAIDAGASVPPELHRALVELLTQFDRQAVARCKCQVDHGDFASLDECTDKTGDELRFTECFSSVLAAFDGDELRAQLRCERDEFAQRGACLESASCADDDVVPCLKDQLACPMFDPQLLTRLLADCPGAAMLGR